MKFKLFLSIFIFLGQNRLDRMDLGYPTEELMKEITQLEPKS